MAETFTALLTYCEQQAQTNPRLHTGGDPYLSDYGKGYSAACNYVAGELRKWVGEARERPGLLAYVQHKGNCAKYQWHGIGVAEFQDNEPCTCGLDALLASAPSQSALEALLWDYDATQRAGRGFEWEWVTEIEQRIIASASAPSVEGPQVVNPLKEAARQARKSLDLLFRAVQKPAPQGETLTALPLRAQRAYWEAIHDHQQGNTPEYQEAVMKIAAIDAALKAQGETCEWRQCACGLFLSGCGKNYTRSEIPAGMCYCGKPLREVPYGE